MAVLISSIATGDAIYKRNQGRHAGGDRGGRGGHGAGDLPVVASGRGNAMSREVNFSRETACRGCSTRARPFSRWG